MALTDPLGDLLTRIRNGQRAKKDSVLTPASKLRARVLNDLAAWRVAAGALCFMVSDSVLAYNRFVSPLPAAQLLVATGALALVVVPRGDAPSSLPMAVLLAMAALGVLGTGLAYVLLYRVVALAGAVTATTVWGLVGGVAYSQAPTSPMEKLGPPRQWCSPLLVIATHLVVATAKFCTQLSSLG